MAKKKNITQENILEWYMDSVLMGHDDTKTVYAFAKKHNFDESLFYEHFNSLESIDKEIFSIFCTKTIELLQNSKEYGDYDAKNKLLSFYYTFFEMLGANRSYVFYQLKQRKDKLQSLKMLSKLREVFQAFVRHLEIKPIDFENDKINKIQDKGIEESAWVQLLMTMKFWLEDDSKGFEKTDIFIEKSIKAQFDLMDVAPVKSVFDFAKFLWKEKMVS